jgi:hypothetical protein
MLCRDTITTISWAQLPNLKPIPKPLLVSGKTNLSHFERK